MDVIINEEELYSEVDESFVESFVEDDEVEVLINEDGVEVENIEDEPYTSIVEVMQGPPGKDGKTNLFIQDTQPETDLDRYVWFETEGGLLKTLWVETGGAE